MVARKHRKFADNYRRFVRRKNKNGKMLSDLFSGEWNC